jgi:uncharacterized repeat protein (TIGR01451 family)
LIQSAFEPEYWDSTKIVVFDELGATSVAEHPGRPLTNAEFSLAEMNFSLFFGLSLQLYQATLVSDQSPFDLYQQGELSALNAQELRGMDIFANEAVCTFCHLGPEFTSASVSAFFGIPIPGFPAEPAEPIERMAMANGVLSVYDLGFYNIGVRPTQEDLGQGATDPFNNPLSFTRLLQNGTFIGPPLDNPPAINPAEPSAVNGAFKTPSLRNLDLTAPYMHNGGMSTIEQVIDFYVRGADFPLTNIADLAPAIVPLPLTEQDEADLAAFLRTLTDERVRYQRAPFDHPQIYIPNGNELIEIAATGTTGAYAIEPFVEINPALEVTQNIEKPTLRLGHSTPITLTIANSGDVILRNIVVESNLCTFGAPLNDLWTSDALDPGESWLVTCQATPTESGTSLVTVSGRHKLEQTISANSAQAITVQKPAIEVEITPQPASVQLGQTVQYNYRVTNVGDVPLTGITLVDNRLGPVSLNLTTLGPDQEATGSRTYVAQVADILPNLSNQATASGQPPLGDAVTAVANVSVDVTGAAIHLDVQPNQPSVNVGESMSYLYTVTNLGDVELSSITVTDNRIGAIELDATILAAGENATGTASTLILPADQPGPLLTSATANGTTGGGETVTFAAVAQVTIAGSASLTATQSNPASAHVNSAAEYSFQVTNNGPVTFTQLEAYDTRFGPMTLSANTLPPGQSATATASLPVTQQQLPGPLHNTFSVTGTTEAGLPVVTHTSGTLGLTSTPRLEVSQEINAPQPSPGKSITYTFYITNTGDVTLQGLQLNSSRLGPVLLNATELAPQTSAIGTGYYQVKEADLLSPFQNNATASALPRFGGGPTVTAVDNDTVALVSHPAIAVSVTPNPPLIGIGMPVSFLYQVTNVGDVTLNNIVLSDQRTGVVVLPQTTLAPGASMNALSTYIVQEQNLPGPLQNQATVQGRTAQQQTVTHSMWAEVGLTTGPALQVLISADPPLAQAGADVELEYLIKNVGNVTLDGIVVSDSYFGNLTLETTSLAPGISTTVVKVRSVTESDLPGPLRHTANATGSPVVGDWVNVSTELEIPLSVQPVLNLEIVAHPTTAPVGATVHMTYTARNAGNVMLNNLAIEDARLGVLTLATESLAPGESVAAHASYIVKEQDLPGPLLIQAEATALPVANLPQVASTATASVMLTSQPALALEWMASKPSGTIGQPVTYYYVVTNAGNVSVENLTLTDSRLGAIPLAATTLGAGEKITGSTTLVPKQGDLPGPITTQASVTATPGYGSGSVSSAKNTSLPLGIVSVLSGHIEAPPTVQLGGTLQYTYRITNTGDTVLVNLAAHDSVAGKVSLATTVLAPGASTWGTASLLVEESQLPGPIINTVTLTGTPPVGQAVISTLSSVVEVASAPKMAVTLVPDKTEANIGESVTVHISVRNDGDVTLENLSLTSASAGVLVLPGNVLAPGETLSTSILAPVSEADIAGLEFVVTAVAIPRYTTVPIMADAAANVKVLANPKLELTVVTPIEIEVGATATIEYTLHNRGNTSLHNLTLTDQRLGTIPLPATSLLPGKSLTTVATLLITEDDLPAPLIVEATAQAAALQGQSVQASSQAAVAVVGTGNLEITIGATTSAAATSTSAISAAINEDTLALTYEVRNTGKLTLNDLTLVDDRFGPITLNLTTLQPGAVAVGNLSHTITTGDLDGAFIHNVQAQARDRLGRQVVAQQSNTVALSGGSLTIHMDTGGDSQPTFAVTINGSTHNVAGEATHQLDALPTGRYEVHYSVPASWKALRAECDATEWLAESPSSLALNLQRGQHVNCTFFLEYEEPILPTGAPPVYLPSVIR